MQRELKDARLSHSSASTTAAPSTLATCVGGPKILQLNRRKIATSTGPASMARGLEIAAVSLHSCGLRLRECEDYPRPEDMPTQSGFGNPNLKDSLQFQLKGD